MSKSEHQITGIVEYHDIETGFWGVTDENGNNWRPFPMPGELQKNGLKVKMNLLEVQNVSSMIMWGKPAKIKKYQIIE